MLIHLEKGQNLEELTKKGTVLVDFFATWCGPCKMLTPELEDLASENEDITVIKVDVDEFNSEAADFMINVVPTLIVFKNGENKARTSGYKDKDALLAFIKNA